jgi:hypothetical protein
MRTNEAVAKFSRRQVLAGAGAVTLGGVLAACGGGDEETPEVATTTGDGTA